MAQKLQGSFFLDQHGCAKNQVDGELLIGYLTAQGMTRTDNIEEADLIIVNSCGFIESAKTESINAVLEAKKAFPKAKLLLAGCLAERYADVFKTDLPEADGIFGNGDLSHIVQTVSLLLKGERPVVRPPQKGVCCGDRDFLLSYKGSAYVKITEGCNNCCTFCAIPLIRGSLRSRPVDDIVQEIKELIDKGTKEINLIGQDLAAYGCGKDDNVLLDEKNGYEELFKNLSAPLVCSSAQFSSFLKVLLERISLLQGDFWLRLLYIHPDHFNADILPVMQKDKRIVPYFDIPFQSGSTEIIRKMNRKGSFLSYTHLVEHIRSVLPECCIRTTFLTGFPGESDEYAKETETFLLAIKPDWSGCFAYSKEEGTPAAKQKGQVAKKTAQKRAHALEDLQEGITEEKLKARCGKTYTVLIEEIVQNETDSEGLAIGRAWFQAPEVDGNVVVHYDLEDSAQVALMREGQFVKVHCFACSGVDLDGELVM